MLCNQFQIGDARVALVVLGSVSCFNRVRQNRPGVPLNSNCPPISFLVTTFGTISAILSLQD